MKNVKLTLTTFKYLWVLYRKRILDGNVTAVGIFQTKREAQKIMKAMKGNDWSTKNKYSLKKEWFSAVYKMK